MTAGSNNDFRIAGALGVVSPAEPNQEVLSQGLGFPLRPISGVPKTSTPTLPEGVVAEGIPTQWMGDWQEGLYYPAGAEVLDGAYNCIANTLTLEKPAPVPDGAASFSLPAYIPAEPDFTGFVRSGNIYTITETGWVKTLRVWLPEIAANVSYQVIVVRTNPDGSIITSTFANFIGLLDGWAVIAALNAVVVAGTTIEIYLDALNSGGNTDFSGGWNFTGSSQSGAPAIGSWNRDNQFLILRVNDLDLDSTDRTTELNGVIANSTILVVDTLNTNNFEEYRVNTIADLGTYVQYGVTLIDSEGIIAVGATTTVNFSVPIAQATVYAEDTAVWPAGNPTWGTVEGYLELSGVAQAVPTNAYGVDIEFQPAAISTDWDIKGITTL